MSFDAERELSYNTPCRDCHMLGHEHLPDCPNAVEPDEPARPIPPAVAAQHDVDAIERAAERLAVAIRTEMELEDQRPIVKMDAVKRIMARGGIAATPAEKIVETDEVYTLLRKSQYAAVVETQRARGAFETAKRRADLAIARLDLELLGAGAIR